MGEMRVLDHSRSEASSKKLQSKLEFNSLQGAIDDDILLVKVGGYTMGRSLCVCVCMYSLFLFQKKNSLSNPCRMALLRIV